MIPDCRFPGDCKMYLANTQKFDKQQYDVKLPLLMKRQ
jgi:hypothetical protein